MRQKIRIFSLAKNECAAEIKIKKYYGSDTKQAILTLLCGFLSLPSLRLISEYEQISWQKLSMHYRMSMIYGHLVIAATRALRFSDHVTKRNGGSGDENDQGLTKQGGKNSTTLAELKNAAASNVGSSARSFKMIGDMIGILQEKKHLYLK